MTDPTQEQRARWLEKFRDVSFATAQSKDPEAIVVTDDDTIVALCATIAAEAVETERKRCADIVFAARMGKIDQDFRSIGHRITSGENPS